MPNIISRLVERLYAAPSVLLVLCMLFWGGNAMVSRLAVGEITPLTLVFLRWTMVLAVMWPIYGKDVRAHWPLIKPRLGSIIAMATLGFTIFNLLFYIAGHYTTALNIGILQGSMPAFVMTGAFLAHGTRVSLTQIIGVLITIAGVLVVATRGHPETLLALNVNFGDILMLGACMLYAAYSVALRNRPAMNGATFFALLALIAAYTSVPLITFELMTDGLQIPTAEGFVILLFVAIFPSCLAQLFFLRAVDLIGPGRAGVYINLVPVFAAILAVVGLGETFAAFHAVALALVLTGILLAQRQPKAPAPKPAATPVTATQKRSQQRR